MNLRRLRIDDNSTTIMLTAPIDVSAIPSTWNGNPLMQDVPRPDWRLSVHAESNVCDALITQRPTPTVTKHKIDVSALFTYLVYHHEGV